MSTTGSGASAAASLGFDSRFVLNGILTHSATARLNGNQHGWEYVQCTDKCRRLNRNDRCCQPGPTPVPRPSLEAVIGRLSGFPAEGVECLLVIGMPARKRRAVLDNVSRSPQDASLVESARHVVVGAENVEVTRMQPLHHEIDGLLGRPGAGRLLRAAFGRKIAE